MIPLRDVIPSRTTPGVTVSLIAVNVAVYVFQLMLTERGQDAFIIAFGLVPAYFSFTNVVTAMFVHGGFVHLAGNMIYLWVFGGVVEDVFGHVRYLIFFIACGAIGSIAHALVFPTSTIPSIGASGSIAGILGAFLVLRPHAQIVTLFPLVVYWAMAEIRAALFLPVWFLMQFFNGFLSLAAARQTEEVAGVAWWAHVGGFVFGAIVAALFRFFSGRKAHA